jgi:hypothetical protein
LRPSCIRIREYLCRISLNIHHIENISNVVLWHIQVSILMSRFLRRAVNIGRVFHVHWRFGWSDVKKKIKLSPQLLLYITNWTTKFHRNMPYIFGQEIRRWTDVYWLSVVPQPCGFV